MKEITKQTPKSHFLLLFLLLLQVVLIYYTPYGFSWEYNPGILFVCKFSPTVLCAIEVFLLHFGTRCQNISSQLDKSNQKHKITILSIGCIVVAMIIASQFHTTATFLQLSDYNSYLPLLNVYVVIALICLVYSGFLLLNSNIDSTTKNFTFILILALNCANATIRRFFYVYDLARYDSDLYTILLPILVGVLVVVFFKLKTKKVSLEY